MKAYIINLSAPIQRQERNVLNCLLIHALEQKPVKGLFKLPKPPLLAEIEGSKEDLNRILEKLGTIQIGWKKSVGLESTKSTSLVQYLEIGQTHVTYQLSKPLLGTIHNPAFFALLQVEINRGIRTRRI